MKNNLPRYRQGLSCFVKYIDPALIKQVESANLHYRRQIIMIKSVPEISVKKNQCIEKSHWFFPDNFPIHLFRFQLRIKQERVIFSTSYRKVVKPATTIRDIPESD